MRGYVEWPARVIAVDGNSINVEFFGDRTTHTTTIKHTYDFHECFDIILNNLRGRKNPHYRKAIKECELVLGVSDEKSILNK